MAENKSYKSSSEGDRGGPAPTAADWDLLDYLAEQMEAGAVTVTEYKNGGLSVRVSGDARKRKELTIGQKKKRRIAGYLKRDRDNGRECPATSTPISVDYIELQMKDQGHVCYLCLLPFGDPYPEWQIMRIRRDCGHWEGNVVVVCPFCKLEHGCTKVDVAEILFNMHRLAIRIRS